jgi:hypothetical protein
MRRYNIVQTGPNIQEGGFKAGFSNPIYQVVTEALVKNPLKIPTPSTSTIAIKHFEKLFIFIF